MSWLYQIKTNTAQETIELTNKLLSKGYSRLNHVGDFPNSCVVLINTKKGLSWNSQYYLNYGKELNYIKDADFINSNILHIKPAPPKLEFKEITNFSLGDLFISKENKNGVIVVEAGYNTGRYTFTGFNGLELYSTPPMTKEKMIEYLNFSKRIFVTNLNDKIKKTIDMALNLSPK